MELAPSGILDASRTSPKRAGRINPRGFGRGPEWHAPIIQIRASLGEDLKLFAMTFLAGFIFISVLIA